MADVVTPAAGRPGPSRPGEHSAAPRRPASAVPSVKGLRISPPGYRAALVNISATGLLAEWGLPLKIGQTVTVAFEGTFTPQSVAAQVVRSSIASMTSASLRYHVGLAFTAPIALEDQAPPATGAAKAPALAAVPHPAPLDDGVNQW
jgi:hypothetical protein